MKQGSIARICEVMKAHTHSSHVQLEACRALARLRENAGRYLPEVLDEMEKRGAVSLANLAKQRFPGSIATYADRVRGYKPVNTDCSIM